MQALGLVMIGLLGIGCGIFLLIGRKPQRSPVYPTVETTAEILQGSPVFGIDPAKAAGVLDAFHEL